MELKLNIYDKNEVIKSYVTDTYEVKFGTLEDLLSVLDTNVAINNRVELVNSILLCLPKCKDVIKPLFKDIFDGITDEELKKCSLREMSDVLYKVVLFTIIQIAEGNKSKN